MQYILYSADNVILTHVIKCRIDVGELQQALELEVCALCSEPAAIYCEDDQMYFCASCDELAH